MADKPLFQKIAQGMPANISALGVQAARKWFQESVAKIKNVNINKLFTEQADSMVRDINITSIGSMYQFIYDPKWKEKLPYYDIHPLIIVMAMYPDGFSGINLHYLSPYYRAKLMDKLYDISTKQKDMMKIQISYDVLNSARRFRLFKPCYKRYLNDHVRSRFMFVDPKNWDMAVQLPTQRFVKQSEEAVWAASEGYK